MNLSTLERQNSVTVIMPAYNCENYLEEAVESVKAQTFKNWILLIIEDCSTDKTRTIAEYLAESDSRIRVLVNSKNIGVSGTRNRGIKEANSEWIAFLDSDDIWEPDKLERQLNLADQDTDIIYCSYDLIDENGNVSHKAFIVPEETNFRLMLTSSVISCSTAVIRTKILKEHMFNPDIYHEDYMLWMELLRQKRKAIGDKKVLAHYRQVNGARNSRKGNAAKERWYIYRKHLKLNLLTSIYAFIGYAFKGIIKYYF